MIKNKTTLTPMLQALTAALLFGASAPLAKLLLGEVAPIPLAAFLYLGSGAGLMVMKGIQLLTRRTANAEAALKRGDLGWLLGAILAGGVAAPITLLFSLQNTPAATASILLNFEGVATTLIAALAFKEAIGRRAWGAIGLITLASILLSLNVNERLGFSLGSLGIVVACVLWGLDNNFTRNISAKDPLMIVMIKGLGAGTFSLVLGFMVGGVWPTTAVIFGAMLLGSLSYGLSIVLFIRAMRHLGVARTSALFSTAPLAGMVISFLLFRELPSSLFLLALPLMLVGTLFLVSEDHLHGHVHQMVTHEHAHTHDDHHEHAHDETAVAPHTLRHTHESLAHDHDHLPDLHHRHEHLEEL